MQLGGFRGPILGHRTDTLLKRQLSPGLEDIYSKYQQLLKMLITNLCIRKRVAFFLLDSRSNVYVHCRIRKVLGLCRRSFVVAALWSLRWRRLLTRERKRKLESKRLLYLGRKTRCVIFERNFVEIITRYWMVGKLGRMRARGFGAIIWRTGATWIWDWKWKCGVMVTEEEERWKGEIPHWNWIKECGGCSNEICVWGEILISIIMFGSADDRLCVN